MELLAVKKRKTNQLASTHTKKKTCPSFCRLAFRAAVQCCVEALFHSGRLTTRPRYNGNQAAWSKSNTVHFRVQLPRLAPSDPTLRRCPCPEHSIILQWSQWDHPGDRSSTGTNSQSHFYRGKGGGVSEQTPRKKGRVVDLHGGKRFPRLRASVSENRPVSSRVVETVDAELRDRGFET